MTIDASGVAAAVQQFPVGDDGGLAAILAREASRQKVVAAEIATAKREIFAALAAANVTSVRVSYDGYGDEGQFEDYVAASGDGAELPLDQVAATVTVTGGSANSMTVAEAVETLCFDLLEAFYDGYENNDGAYGEFVFDVAAGTIRLVHNDRYTAVDTSEREF